MEIATAIALIISQGLPVAAKLAEIWSRGTPMTSADWETLLALGKQTARSQMLLALAQAGIDPASPQGVAFLALTPP
jgi:hypothetical protein